MKIEIRWSAIWKLYDLEVGEVVRRRCEEFNWIKIREEWLLVEQAYRISLRVTVHQ
jgi:hypothetical protein